jgi:hypothetical protein
MELIKQKSMTSSLLLQGTFSIRKLPALNPKMLKEPSSPSRTDF